MNYIGSKGTLLDFIDSVVNEFADSHRKRIVICDAFAGTGIVGLHFRREGHSVIANDLQYYSYVLNKNLIENPSLSLDKLGYLNNLPPVEGFMYQNYCAGSGSGRMYFSDENGKRCDAIRQEIERMWQSREISEGEYFAYLAALIEAIDKVANTAAIYGAFLKKLKPAAQRRLLLQRIPTSNETAGKVCNTDANQLVRSISGDVLYLDPPYNIRQYSSNYHLLETIARYDAPELRGKTGLRETTSQNSKYASRRMAASAFEDLIKNAKFKVIVMSYSNEGLMSEAAIRQIMSRYGTYYLRVREHRRFMVTKSQHQARKSETTTEHIHVLVKHDY